MKEPDRLSLSKELNLQVHTLGQEGSPLLVVDHFVAEPSSLREHANQMNFQPTSMAYPGIRSEAPRAYRHLLLSYVRSIAEPYFGIRANGFRLPMCHYSLVTTPPEKLSVVQRVPHIDSFDSRGLATVHYLFRGDHGGTSFYRHRQSGYEVIDEERKGRYFSMLEREVGGPNCPPSEYINGDTPLFERVASQRGVFNRLLIYRRNSLHSGDIEKSFVPDFSPETGRLSINSFVDPV